MKNQIRRNKDKVANNPKWWAVLLPLSMLIALQSWLVMTYGSDALGGASQVALLLTAGMSAIWGHLVYGKTWRTFGEEVERSIGRIATAMLILLAIGMLSSTWMVSGIVPTFICYGLKILSPRLFLFTACLISALIAITTGSSWTTIATIGVGLIGIGNALGFHPGLTAGAIISGAYFGDKISPLSDTTVLASSSAGTDIFTHIRYMAITTLPSITIALLAYLVLSLLHPAVAEAEVEMYDSALRSTFHISPWLLIVPGITALLIIRKVPALITLLISALAGSVAAFVVQPHILWHIATGGPVEQYAEASWGHVLYAQMESLYSSTHISTGSAEVDSLVSTHGMMGMLNTIFLVISAATFGASLVASGMLGAFTGFLKEHLSRRSSVVGGTVGMGILSDIITGDQYLSIMLTCNIFRPLYERQGYESRLLSRSAEDSATVTSVLIPWNSCGMTQAMVLGVSTIVYAPFCFFNLLSPLMSVLVAAIGFRIPPPKPKEVAQLS